MVCSGTCLYMHILACLCLRLSWSDLYALETNYLIQVQSKCSVPTPPPDCDKFFVKSSSTGHRFFFWVSPISDVMSKELWGIPINPQDWSPAASMCTPKKSFTVWGHQKKQIKFSNHLHISRYPQNPQTHHAHTHTRLQRTIVFGLQELYIRVHYKMTRPRCFLGGLTNLILFWSNRRGSKIYW